MKPSASRFSHGTGPHCPQIRPLLSQGISTQLTKERLGSVPTPRGRFGVKFGKKTIGCHNFLMKRWNCEISPIFDTNPQGSGWNYVEKISFSEGYLLVGFGIMTLACVFCKSSAGRICVCSKGSTNQVPTRPKRKWQSLLLASQTMYMNTFYISLAPSLSRPLSLSPSFYVQYVSKHVL